MERTVGKVVKLAPVLHVHGEFAMAINHVWEFHWYISRVITKSISIHEVKHSQVQKGAFPYPSQFIPIKTFTNQAFTLQLMYTTLRKI